MLSVVRRSTGSTPTVGDSHLVDLRQVVKIYDDSAVPFTALKGVDLQVDGGEFLSIVGRSGSGKSTLINVVTGIDRPTSGRVLVGGTAVHDLDEGGLALWRGRTVGVIFQFFQLLPTLTAFENVILPMDYGRRYAPRDRPVRALYLLEQVGMVDEADALPAELSGGQLQRVAIARALANDPPLIAADEPTGNLDTRAAERVTELFEVLVEQGKAVLMVTHDDDLARRASRTVVIADGQIVDQRTN